MTTGGTGLRSAQGIESKQACCITMQDLIGNIINIPKSDSEKHTSNDKSYCTAAHNDESNNSSYGQIFQQFGLYVSSFSTAADFNTYIIIIKKKYTYTDLHVPGNNSSWGIPRHFLSASWVCPRVSSQMDKHWTPPPKALVRHPIQMPESAQLTPLDAKEVWTTYISIIFQIIRIYIYI